MPDPKLPTRLYKYQPFTTLSLANLKNRSLWFGRPTRFNDPFDCALSRLRTPGPEAVAQLVDHFKPFITPEDRRRYFDLKGDLNENFRRELLQGLRGGFVEQQQLLLNQRGVSCFAERNDSLLMWAHYAQGHRGFCLEFDTAFEPFHSMAHPVCYSDEMPDFDPVAALLDPNYNVVKPIILTKSSAWAYECEWRLLHLEPDKIYTYDWRSLTGIFLGCAMPNDDAELICMVLRDSPTSLYRMQRSDSEFRLSAVQFSYQPYQYR